LKSSLTLLAVLLAVFGSAIIGSGVKLAATEVHRLSNAGNAALPLKCDGAGNIYGRFGSGGPSVFQVSKFAPDGAKKSSYSYQSEPDLKAAFLEDFAVGDSGEVYELLSARKNRSFLVAFRADGEVDEKAEIAIGRPLNLSHIVALAGGRVFVSGSLAGDELGRNAGKPFNAILDDGGNLIREITLKDDASPKEAKTADPNGDANPAVRWGRAVGGDDGNIYVMRQGAPAVVYVVSPGGGLVRKLKIASPLEKAQAIDLRVNRGRLAIEFSLPDAPDVSDTRIRVADAYTGRSIADYAITPQMSEAVACYQNDGNDRFTFLGSTDGWPAIVQASAR